MKRIYLSIVFLYHISVSGQVISWTPLYPSIDDTLTVTYDASLGNGTLVNTNDIYAHTGVINKYSSSNKDWKHIPIQWHEGGDSIIKLDYIGGDLYRIKFKIKSYYGLSYNEKVSCLNFIFRNNNGSLSGTDANGLEFTIPIFENTEVIRFTKPLEFPLIKNLGDDIRVEICSKFDGMINLFKDGQLIAQNYGDSLTHNFLTQSYGKHYLHYEMQLDGNIYTDSLYYIACCW